MKELVESGLPPYDLYFAIEHDEFWSQHGSDEKLVELLQRADHWRRRRPEDPGILPEEIEADMALANRLRNERYVELRRRFRPRARQEVVIAAIDQSEALLHDPTLSAAVARYDRLDRDLAIFERHLPAAVGAIDAMAERQMDAALDR
jgi:hypothetical protein